LGLNNIYNCILRGAADVRLHAGQVAQCAAILMYMQVLRVIYYRWQHIQHVGVPWVTGSRKGEILIPFSKQGSI